MAAGIVLELPIMVDMLITVALTGADAAEPAAARAID